MDPALFCARNAVPLSSKAAFAARRIFSVLILVFRNIAEYPSFPGPPIELPTHWEQSLYHEPSARTQGFSRLKRKGARSIRDRSLRGYGAERLRVSAEKRE